MKKLVFIFFLITLFSPNILLTDTLNLKKQTLRFCAGVHEWPPYYYIERIDGKKTGKIVGFDIELFKRIFDKNEIPYTVELIPWKRCLLEVLKGKKHDVVFGGGLNTDRKEKYVTTKGYYSVTPYYFYLKENFKKGLNINSSSDINKFGRLCGISGFNYVNFGQKNDEIDMGAEDYNSLILKTLTNRCDISFLRYEILQGWKLILDKKFKDEDKLGFSPIPHNKLETFHLMISKKFKFANELKIFFELQLEKLEEDGKLDFLLSNYNKQKY